MKHFAYKTLSELQRATSETGVAGQYPAGCPPFDKSVYGSIVKEARASQRNANSGLTTLK